MTALAEIDDMIHEDDEEENNAMLVKTDDSIEAQDSPFCGVDMDDMTLPCGMGGAAATATLPRELISRLSLLPDATTTNRRLEAN